MSIDLVAATMWLDLTPAQKLVLVSLADRANGETGLCWPGRDEIAWRSSVTVRSVTDQIKALEMAGWLESGPKPGRPGQTTKRILNVKRIIAEASHRRTEFLEMRASAKFAYGGGEPDDESMGTPLVSNRQGTAKLCSAKTASKRSLASRNRLPETPDERRARAREAIAELCNSGERVAIQSVDVNIEIEIEKWVDHVAEHPPSSTYKNSLKSWLERARPHSGDAALDDDYAWLHDRGKVAAT